MRYVRNYCGITVVLQVVERAYIIKYFITKGIMCIIDIMDEEGNLLEWEKAKQKYDFNMFASLS